MPFLQQLVGIGRSAANRSMCGGTERVKPLSSSSPSSSSSVEEDSAAATAPATNPGGMNCHITGATEGFFSSLLEFAANNDVEALKKSIAQDAATVEEIGLWYCRRKGSGQMVLEHRTALMVAATYGSLDVLRFLLSLPRVDVNRSCGSDKTTALHCAASGGMADVIDAVKLLVDAGADLSAEDANGLRPADAVALSPKLTNVRIVLEELLGVSTVVSLSVSAHHRALCVSTKASNFHSPPLSSSPDDDGSPSSVSNSFPIIAREHAPSGAPPEKKEYPVDPSIPDIKNSIYATDEFRMFSFKVRPCSRAYSHDWTECPFVHPGENARRRDPRKYHYSCVPCPDFRKGACRRGDLCEYAHGVFECWLHPAQYRTRLCKDGTGCARRVCFFAHTSEELRPLFMSTGSAMPSPRSSVDMAAAMSLLPGSPSSVMSPFTPPISPSVNGHSSLNWPQPNVPALHLPGSNLQSSRLGASRSARDMPAVRDYDAQQLLNEFCFSSQGKLGASNRQDRIDSLTPSNLDDLFSAEVVSPRFSSDQGSMFSPSHKPSILSQFQQQQSLLSPGNANVFSPKALESQQIGVSPLFHQASLGTSSPGRYTPLSPRGVEPILPLNNRVSIFAQREKQHQQLRSLSSHELFSGSSVVLGSLVNPSWPNNKWGSPFGMLDWGVNGDELRQLKRSSFEHRGSGDKPDVSWVHSLVMESPTDAKDKNLELGIIDSVGPSASGHIDEASEFISQTGCQGVGCPGRLAGPDDRLVKQTISSCDARW